MNLTNVIVTSLTKVYGPYSFRNIVKLPISSDLFLEKLYQFGDGLFLYLAV